MGGALTLPTIVYLHGFCSSPAGWKSRLLAEEVARRGLDDHFVCPQLSPAPDQAMADVSTLIEALRADGGRITLVGSSLGGHYANHLAEKYDLNAVLINPAAVHSLDLAKFIGDHANFHSGERFTFTPEHAEQLRRLVAQPTRERYWLLLETGDEVLDYHQAQQFYAGCRQDVLEGGDHSFTHFPEYIPQILEFAGL